MRVLLLANERSGLGRSPRLVREIAATLEHEGVVVERAAARPGERICERLAGCSALIAVGGDGTVHHAIGALADSGVPFYHVPAGNENLLARELGSSRAPGAVAAAVRAGRSRGLDVGRADGRSFLIMLSVGPDAGVIHRLASVRGSASGHAMYLGPISSEVARPHISTLTVLIDGSPLVTSAAGQLLVANCRQYATRLNPASEARMDDGLLDVVFMPATGIAGLLVWGLRCALGGQADSPRLIAARGQRVTIWADASTPWQCDGEAGGWIRPGRPLEICVRPRAVRALLPA